MKNLILSLSFGFISSFLLAQTPTWSENVACIIYSHCTPCHTTSLVDYSQVYSQRYSIEHAIVQRNMPPWPPSTDYQALAHERTLSDEEVQLIQDWVALGAPLGDPNLAPTPPVYDHNAVIANPDITGRMDEYTVPLLSSDMYRCFVIPTNELVDKYITDVEVIPGNLDAVHHVLVYQDTSNYVNVLDAADPAPGYVSFGGTGSSSSKLVAGWVPGSTPTSFPSGMGMRLTAGSNIILQIHYPRSSSGITDSTRVNIKLSSGSLREIYINASLDHGSTMTNGPLFIPANTVKTFHSELTVPSALGKITITGIAPHAHLICTSMKSFAITPNNDTIKFIDIPKWDFRWQDFYTFKSPLVLPAGCTLHGYATYDNTSNNVNNPSTPPQNVYLGEATTDEMMLFYFTFLGYQAGDEHIVVDPNPHTPHHDNCDALSTHVNEIGVHAEEVFTLFPNPANDVITLKTDNQQGVIQLLNTLGTVVLSKQLNTKNTTINVEALPTGVYFAWLKDNDGQTLGLKKILIE